MFLRGQILVKGVRGMYGVVCRCGIFAGILEYDLRTSRMVLRVDSEDDGCRASLTEAYREKLSDVVHFIFDDNPTRAGRYRSLKLPR